MNKSERKYYITHVIIDKLPHNGLKKMFFYTGTDESMKKNKYYWGKGNNLFDKEYLDHLKSKNYVIELTEYKPLDPKKTLWLNDRGAIYYADIKNPMNDIKDENIIDKIITK